MVVNREWDLFCLFCMRSVQTFWRIFVTKQLRGTNDFHSLSFFQWSLTLLKVGCISIDSLSLMHTHVLNRLSDCWGTFCRLETVTKALPCSHRQCFIKRVGTGYRHAWQPLIDQKMMPKPALLCHGILELSLVWIWIRRTRSDILGRFW